MHFLSSQLSALASILGDYGAAFGAFGIATYIATAYFAFIGQKTIFLVNASNAEIEQLKIELDGRPEQLNRALLELYARKGVKMSGFLAGLVPVTALVLLIVAFSAAIVDGTSTISSALMPWISNLAEPDPWYVLPVVLSIFYWKQTSLNLRFNPPRQSAKRYLTSGLPAFALLMSAILPAGITLFWIAYIMFSVTQQHLVFRHILTADTKA